MESANAIEVVENNKIAAGQKIVDFCRVPIDSVALSDDTRTAFQKLSGESYYAIGYSASYTIEMMMLLGNFTLIYVPDGDFDNNGEMITPDVIGGTYVVCNRRLDAETNEYCEFDGHVVLKDNGTWICPGCRASRYGSGV